MDDAITTWEARRRELDAEARALDARSKKISALRGVSFLATAALAASAAARPLPLAGWVLDGALGLGFVGLVVRHALLVTRESVVQERIGILDRALARARFDFASAPETAERFAAADHPYAFDLDIVGRASLFQRIDATETGLGAKRLASWLLAPASAEVVRERQEAARELARMPRVREELALAARRSRTRGRDEEPLLAWAKERDLDPDALAVKIAKLVVPVTLAALVIGRVALEGALKSLWLLPFLAHVALVVATRVQVNRALTIASSREAPFGRWVDVLAAIEDARFESPLLVRLRERVVGAAGAARKLERVLGYAELRQSPIVHVFVNPLLLWDLQCAAAVERWRRDAGTRFEGWLDAAAEIEALASLGAYAHERGEAVFPEVDEGALRFVAEGLGHPLIPPERRVDNDVAIDGPGHALLVTGSNMSGKSTLLRAVGVNAVLALAGAPVSAKRVVLGALEVRSSMRIKDDLEHKVSHFYAEITRLKAVLGAAREGRRVMFLLDEILHGTNSRERILGAKSVLKELVRRGAIGAASSHDLGLATLEAESAGAIVNVHFQETVERDVMSFDYRLKTGPVATSNALRLMREMGLLEDDLEDAPDRAP